MTTFKIFCFSKNIFEYTKERHKTPIKETPSKYDISKIALTSGRIFAAGELAVPTGIFSTTVPPREFSALRKAKILNWSSLAAPSAEQPTTA